MGKCFEGTRPDLKTIYRGAEQAGPERVRQLTRYFARPSPVFSNQLHKLLTTGPPVRAIPIAKVIASAGHSLLRKPAR
jgi:hypothetical protein